MTTKAIWRISILLLILHNACGQYISEAIDDLKNLMLKKNDKLYEKIQAMVEEKIEQSRLLDEHSACSAITPGLHCADEMVAKDCPKKCNTGKDDLYVCSVLEVEEVCNTKIQNECPNLCNGWTIIQRRAEVDPRENFSRLWLDYVNGFGDPSREFWLGLEAMHNITSQVQHQLMVLLQDWDGNRRYAEYKLFRVGSAEENYTLTIGGYSGDAGNAMARMNGTAFSTTDNDNDNYSGGNCAQKRGGGGWWHGPCFDTFLNGRPVKLGQFYGDEHGKGIYWQSWLGDDYSLKSVTMKIRPTLSP